MPTWDLASATVCCFCSRAGIFWTFWRCKQCIKRAWLLLPHGIDKNINTTGMKLAYSVRAICVSFTIHFFLTDWFSITNPHSKGSWSAHARANSTKTRYVMFKLSFPFWCLQHIPKKLGQGQQKTGEVVERSKDTTDSIMTGYERGILGRLSHPQTRMNNISQHTISRTLGISPSTVHNIQRIQRNLCT